MLFFQLTTWYLLCPVDHSLALVLWVCPAGCPRHSPTSSASPSPRPLWAEPGLGPPGMSFYKPRPMTALTSSLDVTRAAQDHSHFSITWLPNLYGPITTEQLQGLHQTVSASPLGPMLRCSRLLSHDLSTKQDSHPGAQRSSCAQMPTQILWLQSSFPPFVPQPRIRYISFMFHEIGFEMDEMRLR